MVSLQKLKGRLDRAVWKLNFPQLSIHKLFQFEAFPRDVILVSTQTQVTKVDNAVSLNVALDTFIVHVLAATFRLRSHVAPSTFGNSGGRGRSNRSRKVVAGAGFATALAWT